MPEFASKSVCIHENLSIDTKLICEEKVIVFEIQSVNYPIELHQPIPKLPKA